jgi:hypothetical protein
MSKAITWTLDLEDAKELWKYLHHNRPGGYQHVHDALREAIGRAENADGPRVVPDPDGIAVALEVALWEIGDASWAHVIVDAYLNPEAALRELREEQEKD